MNNADMPASDLTKREHAAIEYMKSMLSNPYYSELSYDEMLIQAKLAANKTFIALEDTE